MSLSCDKADGAKVRLRLAVDAVTHSELKSDPEPPAISHLMLPVR